MKKVFKSIFIFLVLAVMSFTLVACGNPGDKPGDNPGGNVEDDGIHDFVGKFTVYDENGEKFGEETFDGVFAAIDEVGVEGKTDFTVKDDSGKVVFKRGPRNELHMYTKTAYHGMTTNKGEADKFLKEVPYSYVIIGSAGKYYGQSVTRMNDDKDTTYGYEVESGSYLYQFSGGGYVKASCIARLSEVRYRKTTNPNFVSNVYVFMNSNGAGGACDMGVMTGATHEGKFYATTNGFEHPLDLPYRTEPITEMKYDEEKDEYYGADDLYMEYTIDAKGTHMTIKNLRTEKTQTFHEGPSAGSILATKYADTWTNRTMLLATSYVPVFDFMGSTRTIWDPLNGGYFVGMAYEDVQIWKHGEANSEEWYPSSPSTQYGFAYADGGASFKEQTVNGKKQVVHNIFYTLQRY